ncbi:hypothetical protein SSPS47_11270 [Streptomyces sp. S4.7]|uniref:DUF397 domain-containing protein n=1 Tax=Streptomyces sp. S4.7 TaxID=2705439 RepID=UPI0013971E90|nr:DUF397 domain-containing protein [Streptomyces sp. S4.7]QHY95698.1 hypothetical protein SSPS47_11270 [Streptomyces sp. S4.7]
MGVPVTESAEAVVWFKSSYSGGNATECVEAAHLAHAFAVRDSKCPAGPCLAFSTGSWGGFIDALREGRIG